MLSLKVLFTISLFVVCSSAFNQTIIFKDSKGNPVSEVFITSNSYNETLLSDKEGKADLSIFRDTDLLLIQHSRFRDLQILKSELKEGQVLILIEKTTQLPEVYVNHPLRYFLVEDDESAQIETISRDIIKIENPPNSADMLQNTGSITVQKSQGGGGSPIIRGFEANKLLLVVDGVRMNNAIYRSGHLQNSLTIDNSVLDHTEIIFGPSSALYGSDALGGVIHFHTIDPYITHTDSNYFSGSSYLRFNTNNNSSSAHFDFSIGRNNWGLVNSFTASKFGDTRMGKNRTHGYADWGLHPFYAQRINGIDSMMTNSDASLQIGSGYNQIDFMEKFLYQPHDSLSFTLNLQYSTSNPIHRYDKLTEYKDGNLKYAEWYYGPQKRVLASAMLNFMSSGKLFNVGTVNLSYQRIDEDRISRKFNNDSRLYQKEDVNVVALNADFNKILLKSRMIYYGGEIQYNLVQSEAYYQDINSNEQSAAQTRYPQLSNYINSGIYFEYKRKYLNDAVFSAGLRYSFIYAQSSFEDTTFIQLPFSEVNLLTSAPSGHIGLVLKPDSSSIIKMMATSGFRAPNIDDYGKVFEKSGNTVVPNDQLKPEYALGGEVSIEKTFGKEFITFGGTVYGTYLFNAMVRRDHDLNGQDSILYDGEMTNIQTIVNTDNAIIYGTSAYLKINFSQELSFSYSHNLTIGTDLTENIPLSHIPPQFGKITLNYRSEKLNTAFYSFYNFRKNLADYGGSADNLDLTPNEEGTPPWWTLNYRLSYTFFDMFTAQFSVENILDVHYRQFASGVSAPGRNFMIGIRADF